MQNLYENGDNFNISISKITGKLLKIGLVSEDQIKVAIHESKLNRSKTKTIEQILVELGFITQSMLSQIINQDAGGDNKSNIVDITLDQKLISIVPAEIIQKSKIIPISINENEITLASCDIYDILAIDQVKKYFKDYKIKLTYAPESDINTIIDKFFRYEMSIDGILKEIEHNNSLGQLGSSMKEQTYLNPTVRLIDAILVDAVKQGSSDIHFEPEEFFIRIRYRVDGKLRQIRSFHKEYWPSILVRIKIIAGMNITETRLSQDGRISYAIMGRDIDLRVASQPTIHGENIVMRILDKQHSITNFENIGYSKENTLLLKKMLLRPEGIIIVTGPTGSGKTTTLYSILNYINSIEKNIMTLEDPVEYQMPLIRQTQIKENGGINFSDGIKSLLRQDPDVIFIGEIRDSETAQMAIRAAMTGHQVYSTLHTNSAVSAIPRLQDIGISESLLATSIICIIGQRLARKLCNECKEEYLANNDEKKILNISETEELRLFRSIGCVKCSMIGYKGRIAVTEILPIYEEISNIILSKGTPTQIIETSKSYGFVSMKEDGIKRVIEGIIDINSLTEVVDIVSYQKLMK